MALGPIPQRASYLTISRSLSRTRAVVGENDRIHFPIDRAEKFILTFETAFFIHPLNIIFKELVDYRKFYAKFEGVISLSQ